MSALDISDPSRSTNAAFALGRLIEGDDGKRTLISDCGQYKLVSENFISNKIYTLSFNLNTKV